MTVRSGTHGLGQRFFYICAAYDTRGTTVCSNGLRLPMPAADDAILAKLSRYVLDPDVVEGAIADALAELQPSHAALEGRRIELRSEVRKLEDEQARLVAALPSPATSMPWRTPSEICANSSTDRRPWRARSSLS